MTSANIETLIDEAMADVKIVVCPTCKGDRILRRAFGIACPTCGAKGLSTTTEEEHA